MIENPICTHCGAPMGRFTQGGACQRCLLESALGGREQEIRSEVLRLDSEAERIEYIRGVCVDDAAMGNRILAWLDQRSQSNVPPSPPDPATADTSHMTRSIGRYKLLEMIGEGGMGEVWMAEQERPVRRRVALKLIKTGMDTRNVIARFEAEGQALALMNHPNIARIFDAGLVGDEGVESQVSDLESAIPKGRPYLAMELVRGIKITQYCDQHSLSTRDRLELFVKVCQAIQHAHQKGIIHRDIKPSNILVTVNDGVPVPKVIDFGIAKAISQKLTDKTLFTEFQALVGTPAYMSPEQADLSSVDIDTRADIYSLGVLLYELLVGLPPFDSGELMREGLDVLRRTIKEKEPLKPSTKLRTLPGGESATKAQQRGTDVLRLTLILRGDLDWIVLKCLEKDRARRYQTANGLAADIERYLANEPVTARPPSALYRFQKTVQRHKLAFIAAAVVSLVLVIGVSAVIFVQHRANQDYRWRLYVSEVNRAGIAWQAGQSAQMLTLLDRCPVEERLWEWNFLREQASRWKESLVASSTNLVGAALSADGRLVVVAAREGIEVREFSTGQRLCNIPFQATWDSPFAPSPRDETLATLSGPNGMLTLWNMRTGERVVEMRHGDRAQALGWSSDGQRVATGGEDRTLRVWDAKTGGKHRTFSTTAAILAVAFSPGDQTMAVGTSGKDALLLDSSTGEVKRRFAMQGGYIHRLKFSPDGQKLAMSNRTFGGFQRDNRIWSLGDGGSLDLGMGADAHSFAFSPESTQLFVADAAGIIRLWDLERRAEVERFSAHTGGGSSIHVLPDGRILSAGNDGLVKVWQARPAGVVQLKGYPGSLRTLAFSPDSRWLVAAGINRQVFVWDARGGFLSGVYSNHTGGASAVAFSPNGTVATAAADQMVRAWNPATRETLWSRSLAPVEEVYWLAYSPDGKRLYAASRKESVTVLDSVSGNTINTINGLENVVDGLAVSPEGRLLAICHKVKLSVWFADGSKKLWEAAANPERCAAFSPDGKWISTGDRDGGVSLWEVASGGRVRRTLRGHAASVSGVSFSSDASRLVSCGFDGQIKVWDWKAGVELLTLPIPGRGLAWHAVFSPDGKTIAAAGGDGIVTLWKTE